MTLLALVISHAPVHAQPDFQVLHAFYKDVGEASSLALGSDGNLYGTSVSGGRYDLGLAFRLVPDGASLREEIVYEFSNLKGVSPLAPLIEDPLLPGVFYGVAQSGGIHNRGVVFRLTSAGGYAVLHHFTGEDGDNPQGRLLLAVAADTTRWLYGTTAAGGATGGSGAGTIFRVRTDGSAIDILHRFPSSADDGQTPVAGLIKASDDNFYGTTVQGGKYGGGTVFQMTPGGVVTVVHDFLDPSLAATDGSAPYSGVVEVRSEAFLYGTTRDGGSSQHGVAYRMALDGSAFGVVHAFNGANGASPYGSLIVAGDSGPIYGTATAGGASGDGTVFSVDSGGLSLLHSLDFDVDGAGPASGLVLLAGDLLGVTPVAAGRRGTVFRVKPDGSGASVAYEFGLADQGSFPLGGLIAGADGAFYGTTNIGGPANWGTAFRVTPAGEFTVIHTFATWAEGANPTGLMRASDGNLYGTTEFGGDLGCGTVFRLTPAYQVLHSFNNADGCDPWGRLVEGYDGALYGTTLGGGANEGGTLFRITKGGALSVLASFDYVGGASYTLGPVVVGRDGSVYGALGFGDEEQSPTPYGAVFKVDPYGLLTLPHVFTGSDGMYPLTGLVKDADGVMYGTAYLGGANGGGVIYSITQDGVFSPLYDFDPTLASEPWGLLRVGGDGKLYGSTVASDLGATGAEDGVLYEFDPISRAFTVLHALDNALDGSEPFGLFGAGLRAGDGNYHALYGANAYGAEGGGGALFLGGGVVIANSPPDPYASGTPSPAEATGPAGAVVALSGAGSLEPDFDPMDFMWHGPFGDRATVTFSETLPIGTTTVTLDVTDSFGAMSSTSVDVLVRDTTPPTVTVPASFTVNSTSAGVAVVTFTASASDLVDGPIDPSLVGCSPSSGSTFPIGTTTVTCSASDVRGNPGSATFTVTVLDKVRPVLTVPAAMTVEATSSTGAAVAFAASALDNIDGPIPVACTPVSGDTFPLGVTTVTCVAADAAGNSASAAFTVTVRDTTPPALTLPGPLTVTTTSGSGTPVTFSVSATDLVDGGTPVTCVPASGSTFPLGTRTVTCSSSDARHNTASGSFTVTVTLVDTTPPVISGPAGVTAEATGPSGAVVTFTVTAVDNIDGARPVTCVPPSGSTFPIGTTAVTCSATDTHGNTATAQVSVTVRDTTPPVLTVPGNMTVTAQGPTEVTFAASAADSVSGSVPVTCLPASGSTFPLGVTPVTCSASDAAGNTATRSFTITVATGPRLGTFVVFSSERTWLRAKATVITGDVGVNRSLSDPWRRWDHDLDRDRDRDWNRDRGRGHDPDRDRDYDVRRDGDHDFRVEMRIGPQVTLLQPGSRVVGDTVWLDRRSSVYDIQYNELINHGGSVLGTTTSHLTTPVLTLPGLPAIEPGSADVTVGRNATVTLAPGRYRDVRVRQGGTLVLTGGLYQVESLSLDVQATMAAKAAVDLRVRDEFDTDTRATVGPHASAPGLRASNIVIYVAGNDRRGWRDGRGADGDEPGPTVVDIGAQSSIQANIYAPRGTIWLRAKTVATGAFIGESVRVGEQARLTLDSAF